MVVEPVYTVFACVMQHPFNPDFTLLTTTISTTSAMPNARVLRDIKARQGVHANEIARRAYLYVARNETLPPQVRHQAQLQLNTYGRYTRPTTVKNRCIISGKGRGIISEFGLSRVCRYACFQVCILLISSSSNSGCKLSAANSMVCRRPPGKLLKVRFWYIFRRRYMN